MRFFYIGTNGYASYEGTAGTPGEKDIVLTNLYSVRKKLEGSKARVCSLNEVLSSEEYRECAEKTSSYITEWVAAARRDENRFLNVNIFELFSYELTNALVDLMYLESAFERLLSRYGFDSVSVITDDHGEASLFRRLAESKGIPSFTAFVPSARNGGVSRKETFKRSLKSVFGSVLAGAANSAVKLKRSAAKGLAGKKRVLIVSGMKGSASLIEALGKRSDVYFYDTYVQLKKIGSSVRSSIIQIVGLPRGNDAGPAAGGGSLTVVPVREGERRAFAAFNDLARRNAPDYFAFAKRAVPFYKKMLRSNVIDAVVVEEEANRFNRALILSARAENVKVFHIHHSIPCQLVPWTRIHPLYADYLFVGGERTKDIFTGYFRLEKDRVIVTGSPKYDRAFSPAKGISEWASPVRGYEKNGKTVLVVLPWVLRRGGYSNNFQMLDANDRFFKDLLKFNAAHGTGLRFIVKLHPNDNMRNFVNDPVIKSFTNMEICQHQNVEELIEKSDVVLSQWSNACMDTIIKGKPLFIADYTDRMDIYDFRKYGIPKVSDLKSLTEALLSLGEPGPGDREKMKRDYEYLCDGKAGERVARHIEAVLG